jgi:chromosome segregation ATPase
MAPNSNQNKAEKLIKDGPVVGNAKIDEISDIVMKLLEEQRELKSKLIERDNIIADLSSSKNSKRKNTQERERRTKSLKPPSNSKKVGSADNKSFAARRLREKHVHEKDKINAIEDKIQKARRRKAELNKELSSKANKVNGLSRSNLRDRPSSDFDPKALRKQPYKNRDLEDVEQDRSGKF